MNSSKNIDTSATKQICMYLAISIFIIVLFIITPLSNFIKTSLFMKLIALIIIGYTIYLNIHQSEMLRKLYKSSTLTNNEFLSQLNLNLICSYIFTLFIGLLFIFVVKSFF
jgi:hypothetical protein